MLGILAALLLLASLYPQPWGILVMLALIALGILAGGRANYDALALCAALSFPVIGYGLWSKGLLSFVGASLLSLMGRLFLAAVGSDKGLDVSG
ncbi:MAG: hypothetical protein R2880_06195 [Deinococcales bacterium]